MSYYPVLNLPRRPALGDAECGILMPIATAKAKIEGVTEALARVKKFKTGLDASGQNLLMVLSAADAAEFADLYTWVSANEGTINSFYARITQPWATFENCVALGEANLVNEWATKVSRLDVLRQKLVVPAAGGSGGTGGAPGTGQQVIVIWPGGSGQTQAQQGQSSQHPAGQATPTPPAGQTQAPAGTAPATETKEGAAASSTGKKELTKNLLIGGGILAAIGTGIWALVKK